ncbi:hypothetical protein ACFOY8_02270 [Thalassospira xianhensis]|uniref:DUF3592 domain-containing protein n=1 Tax=Thalassospira xianhensis MCCC 1A02616 TaxID=1177929 RepID=A0A367UF49_9PROT|nr:hypothetical protein [Thalassospira xianhensis]RCK06936.1 hypothetical protein TH5_05265 [Thalassospira xianhensis MCCC 1A02616]
MRDPRSEETDFHIQRQVILGLLMLLSVFIAGFIGYEGLPYALTRIDRADTTGTVIKYEKNNGNSTIWYRFTDADDVPYERYVSLPADAKFSTSVGASVDVAYFPLVPSYSDITNLFQYRNASSTIATCAIAATGVFALLFCAAHWRYRKHRKRMRRY